MFRIAMVGLGMASTPHAQALLTMTDRVQIVWAASPSHARVRSFGARFPFPTTNDVAAAISDPDVDAVLLLTPPDTHHELALLAIRHGKHLLVEKPLDACLDRAEQIVEAADRAGTRLGVVLQHRFRPAARRLHALLEAEALGEIQAAHLAVPWWRPQSYYDEPGRGSLTRDGGGVLMTQAIHSLDLLRWLVGHLEVIASQARTTRLHRMEGEDHVTALMRLSGGASASLIATTAFFPGRNETIDVIGTLGVARIEGERLDVRWLDGRDEHVAGHAGSSSGEAPMDFSPNAHRELLLDFVEAALTGRAPVASGWEALATQRLITALIDKAA